MQGNDDLNIDARQLLICLKEFGVPMKDSVPFLCRLKNIRMGSITQAAGYNRNGLSQALMEGRKPRARLYKTVVELLGVDPWAVYEEEGVSSIDPENR